MGNAAASQQIPRIGDHHQKPGRGKERFPPEPQREHGAADTLISGFQPPDLSENEFTLFFILFLLFLLIFYREEEREIES